MTITSTLGWYIKRRRRLIGARLALDSFLCAQSNTVRPRFRRTRTPERCSPLDPDAKAVDDRHGILADVDEERAHGRDNRLDAFEKDMVMRKRSLL